MTVVKTRTKTLLSGSFRRLAIAVATAALVTCVVPAARADQITDDNAAAMMAAAKTPADHAALAAYFTSKAEAAQANAEKHKEMYHSLSGKTKLNMRMHCKSIIGQYENQAKSYTAMAKEEAKLAK
jgi:hypothetical protein